MPIDPKTQNEDGTWKKGVCPNPSGRPNRANFTELLNNVFPDDHLAFLMFSKLYGLNTNTADCKNIIKLIDHVEVKKKFRKYLNKLKVKGKLGYREGWSKLSEKDQIDIVKWLFEHKYGKAPQQVNTEISTPEDRKISIEFVKPKKDES